MQGTIEKRGSIGIAWFDNPPVNAISHDVRVGLINAVNTAAEDDDIQALVIACRGRTFMAGADISEFAAGMKDPLLPEVNSTLASSPKLLVAAMFGTTFGGGFEVALACNYRISAASGKVGLPEVKLGILPGAHGTQRLTRVAGVEFALKLMTSGNPASASEALAAGAIDRIADGDVVDEAVAYAEALIAENAPLRRTQDLTVDSDGFDAEYFAGFRKSIARKTRGMRAPERIIQCVEASLEKPFDEGVKFERAMFMECANDPQAKALQHVFFAERQTGKVPGLDKNVPLKSIESVGVIGAGTMGGGISMNFANVGIPVTILEMNDEALQKGLGIIRKNYEATAKKGRISEADVETRMGAITGTTDYADLAKTDLVIEAVFENMDVKKQVFTTLNDTVADDAILATNTSYLDINEIASVVSNPERVLGMHFFSPANVMKLLEIVRAEKTAPEVLATVLKLGKSIRKVGAVAGVCFGFIGNRMLSGYAREAQLLVLEGAKPEQVDRVLLEFGMPMGIFAMGDLAGIDIGYRLRQQLDESQYDLRAAYVPDKLVELERLGQKTGAGTYDYEPGNRMPIPSPVTEKLIAEAAEEFGIAQREISDEEIIERCFYSLFNSGCNVMNEGMAYRSSDIDIVYIYGYGFPAWRGGPMYWGEHGVGLSTVLDKINAFRDTHGERWWTPSPLLEKLVAEGGSLQDIENR